MSGTGGLTLLGGPEASSRSDMVAAIPLLASGEFSDLQRVQFSALTAYYSDLSTIASSSKSGARVSFRITNKGDRAGACVAQVYVHECRPSVEKPDLELGGFVKADLQPGESQEVTVALDVSFSELLGGEVTQPLTVSSTKRSRTMTSGVVRG